MYRQFLMAALTMGSLALPSAAVVAQDVARWTEAAIESSTEIVSLPDSVPTDLGFTPCGTCGFVTLRMDESSRFFVGKAQVSLADLRRYANRAPTGLDVFYREDTRLVTRIILRTELDSNDTTRTTNPASLPKKP